MATADLLRRLPQVGQLLASERFAPLAVRHGRERVAGAVRAELGRIREELQGGTLAEGAMETRLAALPEAVAQALRKAGAPSLRRVINATGVVLQTNLGRAPLSREALAAVVEVAGGYSNLELDLSTGARSRRDVHAERLILDTLAARAPGRRAGLAGKAAMVVNNCAGATLLALNTLAEGGEVLVSRGELVEIGGGFRVPDILRKSGAALREVGTTNRTRIADYSSAIGPATRLILRVHRSNFRMEGFTAQPTLGELLALGERASLPVFEDQGTGALAPPPGEDSSWLQSATEAGLALVAASGDKLLGGPQCGLLVGTREVVGAMRENPLYRALRVDKLTYAALGATLAAWLEEREGSLPVMAALRARPEELRERCEALLSAVASEHVTATVAEVESVVGGGTTPGLTLPGYAVALRHARWSEDELSARLRELEPPVLSRIHAGQVLLDLRTVPPAGDAELGALLRAGLAL